MFAQFRSQYPQGSIHTEMLPKIEGQFVFRASVADGNQVLSTATAMDIDLETAEDRSIRRALDFAGMSTNMNKEAFSSLQVSQVALMPSSGHNHTPAPSPPPLEMEMSQTSELDFYAPSFLEGSSSSVGNSIADDLSDEIAQTKVEMERLGWTNEQGRDYLMRTFGKKSRQQLNPTELRQFLSYLKSQSKYSF